MKTLFITTLLVAGMLTTYTQACTRVVYLGKNGMVEQVEPWTGKKI